MTSTLFYFLITLLLLVTVHEYGHFLVARLCGVKVLRFSFGFGKVLARWHDKKGTEYAWSLFPLGGYVKMLDESEGVLLESERHLAFNNKSVWARIAIILGGPLFNFILAFVALWLVLIIGIQSLAPIVEKVKPGSISAKAGLEAKEVILTLNNKTIYSWRDFQFALMPLIGSDQQVIVSVKSLLTGEKKSLILSLSQWKLSATKSDVLDSLGIIPFVPALPPIVGGIVAGTSAQNKGLQEGDLIKKVDDRPLRDWLELVSYVRQRPDQPLSLTIIRQGQLRHLHMQIGSKFNNGKKEGFLGVRSQQVNWPSQWLHLQRQAPLQALRTAFVQTEELSLATFSLIGRFITGKLALNNISGPVGIAQGAGESGRSGLAYYLSFLALMSISLGVVNLLPIPMLDGGQLLYCFIEVVRRRPLSDEMKARGTYLGLCVLAALMFLALSNDLSRVLDVK